MNCSRPKVILCAAACLLSQSVTAQDGLNPTLNDTYTFRLGGAFLEGDAKVRSDVKGGDVSGEIDLGDLGADGRTSSPYLSFRWRFAENFRLDLEYFGSKQDGDGTTQADIVYGDARFPVGITAHTEFDADIYAIALGWSFLRDERSELGVGLGVHVADLSAEISGQGFVGDTALPFVKAGTSATAPLPNVRLYGGYAFTPTLALEAGLGYFSLNYDKYEGSLFTGTAALEWRPHRNFGLGAGYTWVDVDVDVDDEYTDDSYTFRLNGPVLYLSAGF